mmetsp:Transcript_29852/g.34208  ORF Transcript_29852/g.34208 Transcript_29852/m.34208 type:complete len:129 (-) Transcript_29852:20-406(-)
MLALQMAVMRRRGVMEVFMNFRNAVGTVNDDLRTRLKGFDGGNGYEELNEHHDTENLPEEQYRLKKQLADRQNEITLLRARINELENSNRRRRAEEKKEEVDEDNEEEKEGKGDGEDMSEYLLNSKKK